MKVLRWLTVKQAAKITGQSLPTVYRYIKKGFYDTKQVAKGHKLYIDVYSIPTFLRQPKIDGLNGEEEHLVLKTLKEEK